MYVVYIQQWFRSAYRCWMHTILCIVRLRDNHLIIVVPNLPKAVSTYHVARTRGILSNLRKHMAVPKIRARRSITPYFCIVQNVSVFLLAEGQYIMIDAVKRRHGLGTHANGKEKYVGEWQHDSMHGEGDLYEHVSAKCDVLHLHSTSASHICVGSGFRLCTTAGERNKALAQTEGELNTVHVTLNRSCRVSCCSKETTSK